MDTINQPSSDTPEVTPPETTTETPSEAGTPEPEATPEAGIEAEPKEALYELPDGRKVNAETLQKEWKENFLPDYTRKSQKLSEFERGPKPNDEDIPAWKRPDYVPQTYAEIIEIAEQRALERLQEQAIQEEESAKAFAQQIDATLAEIKKTDPNLDESALFAHANKFGFNDLTKAHANLKALQEAKLTTEQRTLKNLQTRKETPVSGQPGIHTNDGAVVYGEHSKYGSAIEFLQANK